MRKPVAKAITGMQPDPVGRTRRAASLDNVHKSPVVRIPRHHRGNQEI